MLKHIFIFLLLTLSTNAESQISKSKFSEQSDIKKITSYSKKQMGYTFQGPKPSMQKMAVFGKFGMEWYDVRRYKLEKGKFKNMGKSKSRLMMGVNFFYDGDGIYYILLDGENRSQIMKVEIFGCDYDVALMRKDNVTRI